MSKLDRLEIKGSVGVVLGRLGNGVSTGSVRAGLFFDLTASIIFFLSVFFFKQFGHLKKNLEETPLRKFWMCNETLGTLKKELRVFL